MHSILLYHSLSLHQGWANLPDTSHHAFGDEEHRAAAREPPDHPFKHSQRTGMCDQH